MVTIENEGIAKNYLEQHYPAISTSINWDSETLQTLVSTGEENIRVVVLDKSSNVQGCGDVVLIAFVSHLEDGLITDAMKSVDTELPFAIRPRPFDESTLSDAISHYEDIGFATCPDDGYLMFMKKKTWFERLLG